MLEQPISVEDVHAARSRIGKNILCTPCISHEQLSRELGCEVFFKAENLQHIGAFKARGALNAIMQLSDQQAACGVVTHSSGNHAAALARSANIRGIKAHIVMPENSAQTKIAAVRNLGVEPVFCEPTTPAREQAADDIRERVGATLVHPFNNPHIMAGQGTVGLEILDQVANVDAVIAPVGGGGLLSGIATIIKGLNPRVEVFGAEPEMADDAYRSVESGNIEPVLRTDTIADGLRTSLGDLTFSVIKKLVDGILLVSEKEILVAMRKIVERAKYVVEPSGAVSYAALERHRDRFEGKRVAVVLSGGNVDFRDCKLGAV